MPRTLYILGLIGWTVFVLLLPPWEGRSYVGGPGAWLETGTFGLTADTAPLWNPPTAFSNAVPATVRWPWQPVSRQGHIEPDVTLMAVRWSLGVLALGLLAGGLHWLGARRQRVPDDAVIRLAVHVSLALAIAWLVLLVIGVITMGFAFIPPIILGVLGAGVAGGIVIALLPWRRAWGDADASTPVGAERPVPDAVEAEAPAVLEYEPARTIARPWAGAAWLFWFLIGLIAAGAVFLIVAQVAAPFRGPVAGYTELGTRRYQYDQTPVNVATGMSLLIIGWLAFAVLARWRRMPRPLLWAFALGTTALGLLRMFD